MRSVGKPKYKHDCDDCVWLGTTTYPAPLLNGTAPMRNADLYYCKQSGNFAMGNALDATIIARYSSEGCEYSSMPASMMKTHMQEFLGQLSTGMPALISAYVYAKAKGLVQ